MSRTKHPRPSKDSIELRATREALVRMTERCVHEEARATVAEAEREACAQNVAQLKKDLSAREWEQRRLWLTLWTKAGVKPATLVKYRVEYMRETPEEAKRLVYSGKWSYSLGGLDDVPLLTVDLPEREPYT